jgi:hypothetical protein
MRKTWPKPSEAEFARCRWDPERFAGVYLGINVHPGQRRFLNAYIQRTDSGWRAQWLWLMVAAGNRAGKTLALDIAILHSTVYRIGLKPPEHINDPVAVARWGKLPFHWWHFAVEQAPAEQVHRDLARILTGTHESQANGCPWADQVGGADKIATMSNPGTATDEMVWGPKERGEYAWIVLAPELGGGQIHFRSMKQKALGELGLNMHGVSVDEAGLDPELESHIKEVFHARRLGTGGQLIFISTPSIETSTAFEDVWHTGNPDSDFRLPRRFSMRMSTRDNIGFGIDRESFNALVDGMDEDWIAQNIDGEFIESAAAWFHGRSTDAAFRDHLPEFEEPRPDKAYIQALDPGLKDKTWSVVWRVEHDRLVGVSIQRMQGKQSTPGIVRLGKSDHHYYAPPRSRWVDTGVDTTALGGHIFRDLLEADDSEFGGIPVRSVEFGGVTQRKRDMLSDLRSAIDEGRIVMPASGHWLEMRRQFRNYKLADRKIEQDLVMCAAIAVKLLRSSPPPSGAATTFDYFNTAEPGEDREYDGINSASIRRRQTAMRRKRRAEGV